MIIKLIIDVSFIGLTSCLSLLIWISDRAHKNKLNRYFLKLLEFIPMLGMALFALLIIAFAVGL